MFDLPGLIPDVPPSLLYFCWDQTPTVIAPDIAGLVGIGVPKKGDQLRKHWQTLIQQYPSISKLVCLSSACEYMGVRVRFRTTL